MQAHTWFVLTAWLCWWSCVASVHLGCPAIAAGRCSELPGGHDEHRFQVDGETVEITYTDGSYFSISCRGNTSLDSGSLPAFDGTLNVNHVHLGVEWAPCPPPQHSYVSTLAALHVRLLQRLTLRGAGQQLAAHHLAGLECAGAAVCTGGHRLERLGLERLHLASDVFDATPHLRQLRLDESRPVSLERLPVTLEVLDLVDADVEHLPHAALARLVALNKLMVRYGRGAVHVEPAAPLRELALEAPEVRIALALPDTLSRLRLDNWAEREPLPWLSCAALNSLELLDAAVTVLPDKWLARCSALTSLTVDRARGLANISSSALHGAFALVTVTLKRCALESLPTELLHNASGLQTLDLSDNRLHSLPSGLLSLAGALLTLSLGGNALGGALWTDTLAALRTLRTLRLAHNVRLGDACAGAGGEGSVTVRGTSHLQALHQLRVLDLRNTSATVVCRDWRETMPELVELDLRDNRIEHLTFADLLFRGNGTVLVDLSGNNVTSLQYERIEYVQLMGDRERRCVPGAPLASRADVRLGGALACDCDTLWAARALRDCPTYVRLHNATCRRDGDAPRPLRAVPLSELACPAPAALCAPPAGCQCTWRDALEGRVLRVTCGAQYTARRLPVLRPRPQDDAWELVVPHTGVSDVRAADLPRAILELDLRDNNVTRLPVELLQALAPGARVLLAGNPLSCDCDALPALAALLNRPGLDVDRKLLRCEGVPLDPLPQCTAPPSPAVSASSVALLALPPLLIVSVLAVCAAHPRSRRRLKALLRAAHTPVQHEEADERPYDVFLSFSHHDAATAERLVGALESRGHHVCVHSRDWAPGGYIPAQIGASVRRARRTLALVSRHFLASQWARAEFREAHAAALRDTAPRLLVVLLEEPARLPLDAELRRYVADNTYLLWDDRHFWRKLHAALPAPRARSAAPPALPPATGPALTPLTTAAA